MSDAPFRIGFDEARDPYAARVALRAAPLESPIFTGDPQAPTPAPGDNDTSIATTAFVTAAVAGVAGGGFPQGRLTLVTATPVMITTQSAKTTIYYTPYVGDKVPIYGGSSMAMTTFTELSVATSDTTKSPAAIGTSKVNDWFVWSDAGTIRIGHGPDWTSDTARSAGTALVMVNGILLNNASITNGPTASRGTYVGTTRSNGSSQLDWIFGGDAAGGTAAVLGVYNAYNRVSVTTVIRDTTSSWVATAGVGSLNASTTDRISWVDGLQQSSAIAQVASHVSGNGGPAIGLNSTTAAIGTLSFETANAVMMFETVSPQLGFNYLQALQGAASNTTFYGTGNRGRTNYRIRRDDRGAVMDAGTLYDAIAEVCPVSSVQVVDGNDRSTWSFVPAPGATQAQIGAGNNVLATIPINPLSTVPTGDWISKWTNAEYQKLQQQRISDNGKTAKDWDNVTSDPAINMNKKKVQALKTSLVPTVLTQARADELFS